jgi:hypothetical protein
MQTEASSNELTTTFLVDLRVDLDKPLVIGDGPLGKRVLFRSVGGSFEGPDMHGKVLPGGGDWALFRSDGSMTLDVRLTLCTHDDALIYLTYGGRLIIPPELSDDLAHPVKRAGVDPSRYYFRTSPFFETGSKKYSWLNDIVCVGSGYFFDGGVGYRIFRVN